MANIFDGMCTVHCAVNLPRKYAPASKYSTMIWPKNSAVRRMRRSPNGVNANMQFAQTHKATTSLTHAILRSCIERIEEKTKTVAHSARKVDVLVLQNYNDTFISEMHGNTPRSQLNGERASREHCSIQRCAKSYK